VKFRTRALAVALVLAAALLSAAAAGARTLTFERWDDQIQVDADGSILVTESLTVRFTGAWNGIYRTIPLEYHTDQGFDFHLNVDVDSVTDENFTALHFEQSHPQGRLKLKIFVPGATDTTRTILVKYHVANALRFFKDHDELYWNVTGNEHADAIEHAEATVVLPSGTAGVHAVVYTGLAGLRQSDASIEQRPNEVHFTVTRPLGPREGFTIVAGWDKGFVSEPGPLRRAWDFLFSNWPLGIPIFALVFAVWFYFAHGRDPELRPISVQYEPPQGLSPAGAGALIDDSADMRDITATIVDLAVRGYLSIEETKSGGVLGIGQSKDYVFHRRKPAEEWKGLRPHELLLMQALFGGSQPLQGLQALSSLLGGAQLGQAGRMGQITQALTQLAQSQTADAESVSLSQLHNKFYTHLPSLRESIFAELLGRHYYRTRPDSMHARYVAGAVASGLGIFWTGTVIARHSGMQTLPFVIAAVLTALIVFVYGRAVHARTLEGTRGLEGVLGFKEFLARVESNRYNLVKLTPDMFEKFLPFAMALGCESHWAKAFDGIYTQPPQWYQGSSFGPQFFPSSFTSDLSSMATNVGSAMASVPAQSSGSSGFGGDGGGGSSGGGSGGGDAGGW